MAVHLAPSSIALPSRCEKCQQAALATERIPLSHLLWTHCLICGWDHYERAVAPETGGIRRCSHCGEPTGNAHWRVCNHCASADTLDQRLPDPVEMGRIGGRERWRDAERKDIAAHMAMMRASRKHS